MRLPRPDLRHRPFAPYPAPQACSHCPAKENVAVPPCCGVCVFAGRRCEQFYPGEGRSEEAAADLTGRGFNLGVCGWLGAWSVKSVKRLEGSFVQGGAESCTLFVGRIHAMHAAGGLAGRRHAAVSTSQAHAASISGWALPLHAPTFSL